MQIIFSPSMYLKIMSEDKDKKLSENKELARKIINRWSRPIFNLCTKESATPRTFPRLCVAIYVI